MSRHECRNFGDWPIYVTCEGRIHIATCTTRRDRRKDCCPARHKMLHDQGQAQGILDSSMQMWPL